MAGRCPAGHTCPAGAIAPVPCDIGTYNPTSGQLACIPCPAGNYCDEKGMTQKTIDVKGKKCSAGYYCTGSATIPNPIDGTQLDDDLKININVAKWADMKLEVMPGGTPVTLTTLSWYPSLTPIEKELVNALVAAQTTQADMLALTAVSFKTPVTGNICEPGFYCPEGSAA